MPDWTFGGRPLREQWSFPEGVTYLNHGSFGPSPLVVRQARHEWSERLERQPMDFYLRQMEEALGAARERLGALVGADGDDLVFVDNATYGMNIVAAGIELNPGDEVLATDHEYGAVLRVWRRVCKEAGAKLVVRKLRICDGSPEETAVDFLEGAGNRTKLIVVSHVTSPTALILPVKEICRGARERGVPVCVDGPHAVGMLPLDIGALDCDYYAASCHKWLSAPFGSGFLYVARRRQQSVRPPVLSWGGSVSGRAADWKDEFNWSGTRDPAAFLAVPAAIEFLEEVGLDRFRRSTHELAKYAQQRIGELTPGEDGVLPSQGEWFGSMVAIPIPRSRGEPPRDGHRDPLQDVLWERYRIEVPIVHWQGRRCVRVSCHLYNAREDVERLAEALSELIAAQGKERGGERERGRGG